MHEGWGETLEELLGAEKAKERERDKKITKRIDNGIFVGMVVVIVAIIISGLWKPALIGCATYIAYSLIKNKLKGGK